MTATEALVMELVLKAALRVAVADAHRYADALIEIAAAFTYGGRPARSWCDHCESHMGPGCSDDCPGLLARRALGVA